MTRLAEGGRAAQPGLLCRWWYRRSGRASRKARKAAAARKIYAEYVRKVTR